MDISKIFENNKKWIQSKLDEDSCYFNKLAAGQDPDILYIGCSDSRATAEEIMGLGPGDVFVHRNIANMASNLDLTAMGVINYAVVHLKVKHIVVCGHYGCGGVKAAMQSQDLGILNPYLRSIRDVYRMHKEELNALTDDNARYKRLIELNVQEQCINVLKTSDVQLAFKDRGITVHGWVFDLASGQLIDLNINFTAILDEIMEIYHLD